MAADRQRLAQALAAEAARRKMFESIPEAAGQGLPQAPERPMGWNDYLENLSIGLGRGAVNQMEGIKGMVTSPVETLKGVTTGVTEAVRNPRMVAEALKQTGQRAMSGPLGLGEVIGENVNMMRVPGKPVMAELDVYHGTPHRFPATEANPLGEFDASKIGTGEGAQAFGHGIYMAEKPAVAQDYQFMLSKIDPETVTYQGKPVQHWYDMAQAEQDRAHRLKDKAAIDRANAKLAYWENVMTRRHPEDAKRVANDPDDGWPALANYANSLDMSKFGGIGEAGSLYKADLPDEIIGRMLDWDKPLKEQPANVQKFFSPIYKPDDYLVDWLKQGDANHVAEILREAGVPGIKYLDAGSRGAGGTGTRNFVVFPGEEKKVRILERK